MYESLIATSPPVAPTAADILTLKAHCRVDASDATEDANLALYLQAARTAASGYLKQTLYQTSYTLVRDLLPTRGGFGFGTGAPAHAAFWNRTVSPYSLEGFFKVLNPPLISVESIQYLDTSGVSQVLDPGLYSVVPAFPGRIAPSYGKVWPLTLPQIGAVTLRYTCGYGTTTTTVTIAGGTTTTTSVTNGPGLATPLTTTTAAPTLPTDVTRTTTVTNVPFPIQAGILLWAGSLFRNREAVTEGVMSPLPMGVKELFQTANRGYYR
jgi:hypothetical protein